MKKLIIGVRCYQQVSCLSTYLSLVLHATTHSNTAKRHRQVMPLIRLHVRWIDNLLRLSFIRSPKTWDADHEDRALVVTWDLIWLFEKSMAQFPYSGSPLSWLFIMGFSKLTVRGVWSDQLSLLINKFANVHSLAIVWLDENGTTPWFKHLSEPCSVAGHMWCWGKECWTC